MAPGSIFTPMESPSLFALESISVHWDGHTILNDISLSASEGDFLNYLGSFQRIVRQQTFERLILYLAYPSVQLNHSFQSKT